MSLICTLGTLNLCGHYVSDMGPNQLNALKTVFERMIDLDTVAAALSDAQTFCVKIGSFSSPLAQKMMVHGKTSPGIGAVFISFSAAWWQIFGYSTPTLQKLAM
jgi:hypothetical protein